MNFDINSEKLKENEKPKTQSTLLNYIFQPFRYGIFGFISFFMVLVAAKYMGYLIGTHNSFEIDFEDALLSMLGFVLVFLIKFLENLKEKSS